MHVIDGLRAGGKERQLVELVKGCAHDGGFRSLVISLREDSFWPELERFEGVDVEYVVRQWRYDPMIALRLVKRIRRHAVDVVVAWESLCALYALIAAKSCRIPMVNYMIQDAPRRLDFKVRWRAATTFPISDLVVANSRAGLRAYGYDGAKSAVLRNGYDVRRSDGRKRDDDELRRRWGLPDGPIIGMVAAFRPDKDQAALIRAAGDLLRRHPSMQVVFVGGGVTLPACRRLAATIAPERIHFLGPVGEGIDSLISSFSVGVLATFTEGISNSLMEYMAAAKPVVASAGGGTGELVIDGETGFLVPPGDPGALAAAISELLENEELRNTMGDAGRRRIEQEFSLDQLVTGFRALCLRVRPDLSGLSATAAP
jgi:glycosyltransferase involved in cell wall biosynthesis